MVRIRTTGSLSARALDLSRVTGLDDVAVMSDASRRKSRAGYRKVRDLARISY
ncbi:hypothetical protein [Marinobacter sp. NSM]|uniref:hypothetical protein n=1 Tax=Marinobacter sp. NSM TaxID=3458004 RepID=UPI004035DE0A